MITPHDLKNKCQKYWNAQHIQKSVIMSANLFPLTISKIRFTARELAQDFSLIRKALEALQAQSKAQKGFGYILTYQTIQHRQLGRQTVPDAVMFETLADFLKFSSLSEAYKDYTHTVKMILSTLPALENWLQDHTAKVLEFYPVWPKLLAVLSFLQAHPKPDCYLRELPIQGIDSKFIEKHKAILSTLLDVLLAPEHINPDIQTLQYHGFERRYGFKYPETLIRFRILDPLLCQNKLTDISLPLSEFKSLSLPCEYVIITENKINGLAFPKAEKAIIIFGLGYGIQTLAGIPWLQDKILYYWGDIDTHGFAMLSLLRGFYPQVKNLFMDEVTLQQFKTMAVEESKEQRYIGKLPHLTPKERQLYQNLCENYYGNHLRIEQERIDFKYVKQRLQQIFIF